MKKVYLILSLFLIGVFFSCSDDESTVSTSSLASISKFTIDFGEIVPVYDGLGTDNIKVSVPYGTNDLTRKISVAVSDKATVLPKSGTEITFIDGVAQKFVVTAEDGTKKTYNVTVSIRGEVGSGTKLLSYESTEDWGAGASVSGKATYTYNSANLVETEKSLTATHKYVYNDTNQIIEKITDEKVVIAYTYKDGKIISAEQKNEGVLELSKTYVYKTNGNLEKIVSINASTNIETTESFTITDGNTVKYATGSQIYDATFDHKNNPIIGIFPLAYGKILAVNTSTGVNKNNPITRTGADTGISYEYNNDEYPISATYTYFSAMATVKTTFTYE